MADKIKRMESISGSSLADVATDQDSLGFKVYIEAIGAYLTHEDTKGPLTLSIEGEWGSGKSSFMLQLRKWLKENRNVKTVWFNAWRHDKEEALWAAFALQFVAEMTDQMKSLWKCLRAKWKLMKNRFNWRRGWFDLVRTVITMLLWIVIASAIWIFGHETFIVNGKSVGLSNALRILIGVVGSLATAQKVFSTVRDTVDIVGNPLRFDLKKHIQDLNYAERIGFIEQFHRDFKKIVDVYVIKEKVFVFIDDLDRCKVPKAAEMMQAINLMIGADDRLIFIVGMDRQKIAAGLAVDFEKLLPYMEMNSQGNFEEVKTKVGIKFGYDFIEKFIQLPFRVPIAGLDKIDNFLNGLKESKKISALITNKKRQGLLLKIKSWFNKKDQKQKTTDQKEMIEKDETTRKWNEFALKVADDSEAVQEMVKIVAGFLNYNPRRIKQFINMFRLKAYISYYTGLFNPPLDSKDIRGITFEQLAKFVAIELRWPLFLANLDDDNNLLSRLGMFAENWKYEKNPKSKFFEPQTNIESQWRSETELLELITLNANLTKHSKNAIHNDYSLVQLDISKLLKVSARVTPPEISPLSPTISTKGDDSAKKDDIELRRIKKVMESVKEELLSKANVVGVEVGNKFVSGRETDSLSIRVKVKQKLPKSELSQKDLIPAYIDGIVTDVVEVGGIQSYV